MFPVVEKLQHPPHFFWFLIGVTAPLATQLTEEPATSLTVMGLRWAMALEKSALRWVRWNSVASTSA
jgi:hypothetical protein